MTSINDGRIRESDLVGPALRLMATTSDGFMSTADLITELKTLFNPIGKDAEIAPGRNDTYFSQKVRNLISHRDKNFVAYGYAAYDEVGQGLIITDAGRDLLIRFGN